MKPGLLLSFCILFLLFNATSLEKAEQEIRADLLSKNTGILASDEFEGRAPSSPGEEKTVAFLKKEFQKLGLQPGNHGSFFQEVPLVDITSTPQGPLKLKDLSLAYKSDFVATTTFTKDKVEVKDAEMVFVGFGIVAPEYNWNDYAGLDVKGKCVVVLVNDPGFYSGDPKFFKGKAMTYYGRWTYKYEEAGRQGAAAVMIVHQTAPAAYPWSVVRKGWTGPQFNLESKQPRAHIEGWLSEEATNKIFNASGKNFATLQKAAMNPGFKAVNLNQMFSMTLDNTLNRSKSKNVIATIPGSKFPDEHIFYTAHWDHFGKDESMEGDNIYNGALDNATGTAGLLELARAFQKIKPERSITFLAPTAEEQGLLGSLYYVYNPVVATNKTVAVINMDILNVYGPTKDNLVMGFGNSELEDLARQAAATQDRIIRPELTPEDGFYYRSDHFSFAKVGVPALYLRNGFQHVEKGEPWMRERMKDYVSNHYHKPDDDFDPNWNLEGAVQDLRLIFKVGHELANSRKWPKWYESSQFRPIREKDMK